MTTVPVTGVHLGGANLTWHADLERTCQKRKAARARTARTPRRSPRKMRSSSVGGRGSSGLLVMLTLSLAAASRPPLTSVNLPCVGLVASATRELVVVGTAHTPCNSPAEVSAVISAAKPDVVVLELDQERFEQLMLQDDADRKIGADFAAGAAAAKKVGATIILGDVKVRKTVASLRAMGPVADFPRFLRAARTALGGAPADSASRDLRAMQPVSVLGTLRDDPAKLLPLLAGIWWTILLSAIAAATMPSADAAADMLPDGPLTELAALFAAGLLTVAIRVYDVLIISRDEALAAATLRGLELADSLQRGSLVRRRYSFSTVPAVLAASAAHPPGTLPFFTLRRPLKRGEVRRLNLFEPRWLNLLDQLAAANAPASPDGEPAPFAASDTSLLLNASFGCVFAVNRNYAPIVEVAEAGGEAGGEWGSDDARVAGAGSSPSERIADVVLWPFARRARIERAVLGTRPVSGDRKLEVWIVGEEPLRIDQESLAPTDGGYLAARVAPGDEADHELPDMAGDGDPSQAIVAAAAGRASDARDASAPAVRVVSVVGLAHANGVLSRCAERALMDDSALARTRAVDEAEAQVLYK